MKESSPRTKSNATGQRATPGEAASANSNMADTLSADGSLEKVREILIGAHMREHEKKRAELEDRITAHIDALHNDAVARFEATTKDIEALRQQLVEESQTRSQESDAARQKIDELVESLVQLDAQTRKAHAELHDQLTSASQGLDKQMQASHEELSAQLRDAAAALEQQKADRKSLANMLTEVATRLADDQR